MRGKRNASKECLERQPRKVAVKVVSLHKDSKGRKLFPVESYTIPNETMLRYNYLSKLPLEHRHKLSIIFKIFIYSKYISDVSTIFTNGSSDFEYFISLSSLFYIV